MPYLPGELTTQHNVNDTVLKENYMEHIKGMNMWDMHWQMCFANGDFDGEEFRKRECYKQMVTLQQEYLPYINDPMNPVIIDYWKEVGVKKDYYEKDWNTVADFHDAHTYSVLGPLQVEEGKKYPVVYFSHGGGAPYFDSETYGIAENIKDDPFFYVCPNIYGAEEFNTIIDEMLKNGYPIDESRIYAMGFSGGSGSTADIAVGAPLRVAGVALIPGANSMNQLHFTQVDEVYRKHPEISVPTIFVGGTCDGGDRFPLVDEISYQNYNNYIRYVVGLKEKAQMSPEIALAIAEGQGDQVEKRFGLKFERTYVNEVRGDGDLVYVGELYDDKDECLARFAQVEKYPHGVFPVFFAMAWSFLKKFTKDTKTGGVSYEKPPMDFRTRR